MASLLSAILELELFFGREGRPSYGSSSQTYSHDKGPWVIYDFSAGSIDHIDIGDSCPWPRGKK